MALTRQTMTDEQRKSVALDYAGKDTARYPWLGK